MFYLNVVCSFFYLQAREIRYASVTFYKYFFYNCCPRICLTCFLGNREFFYQWIGNLSCRRIYNERGKKTVFNLFTIKICELSSY